MKLIAFLFSFVFLIISVVSTTFAQGNQGNIQVEERLEAVVNGIKEERIISENGQERPYQKLELTVTSQALNGKRIIVENGKIPTINTVEYNVGDKVSVNITKGSDGRETYIIADYIRRDTLYLLFGFFIALTVLIGGIRGISSLLGMVISFSIIFLFVLPQILAGHDPVVIAIISSLFIIPVTFYLSHGINKKTTSAVIGTIIALIITGILANIFVNAAHLTGFASEEAGFVEAANQGVVQMQGLLLAGIIIGALGVLDDITISQAAIVFQLKKASPRFGVGELFRRAMDIGRDHIASMVNTLVLVYTGAAFPLLLLFTTSPQPLAQVINFELIAEEIVRTLVVSIGLIMSVPIVTLLAAFVSSHNVKQSLKDLAYALGQNKK